MKGAPSLQDAARLGLGEIAHPTHHPVVEGGRIADPRTPCTQISERPAIAPDGGPPSEGHIAGESDIPTSDNAEFDYLATQWPLRMGESPRKLRALTVRYINNEFQPKRE